MLLQTEDLTKDYNGFRALDRLNLTVAAGEVFGLLGPNGSGKSTALRLLLGFLRPTAGRAWIDGHDCWHDSVAARRAVAYLPGELRLYENMTGRQLIHFLGDLRQRADSAEVDRLAGALDIDLSRPIAQLSSGMKRKVALLQVLAPHTPLLILDEPTNTLDPTMRDELLAQLRRARERGQAVLFSSHVLGEVEQVCDRVGILQRGRLVHLQEMAALRQGRLIRARFPRPPERLPDLPDLRPLPLASPPVGQAALPVPSLRTGKAACPTGRETGPGQEVALEYAGPLPPLLDWLARQQATDLTVTPLGLGPIYHRYHGPQA